MQIQRSNKVKAEKRPMPESDDDDDEPLISRLVDLPLSYTVFCDLCKREIYMESRKRVNLKSGLGLVFDLVTYN